MIVEGRVVAETAGGSIEIVGEDDQVVITLAGRHDVPRRRQIAGIARFADVGGLTVTVADERGRKLAELGHGVSSPAGRAFIGSSRVRPRGRGALRWLRSAVSRRPT